jgi:hypothetical protein
LVGVWKASDPSGAGGITGQTTYEWVQGSHFLPQHVDFDSAKGSEIVGYDEENDPLKSHYFAYSSSAGGFAIRRPAVQIDDSHYTRQGRCRSSFC